MKPLDTAFPQPEVGLCRDLEGARPTTFGGFKAHGVRVERHRFRTRQPLDWGRSLHPDSLEVCLNLQGSARFEAAGRVAELGAGAAAYYGPGVGSREDHVRLSALRAAGVLHRFVTVEMSRSFLAARLGRAAPEALHPSVRAFLRAEAGRPAPVFVETLPMDRTLRGIARALAELPRRASSEGGRPWDGAKALELIFLLLFVPVAASVETISSTLQKFGVRREPRPPGSWKPLASY